MKNWKDTLGGTLFFCIVATKWGMVTLGKQHDFYGILSSIN
jgi:hypothetical protein